MVPTLVVSTEKHREMLNHYVIYLKLIEVLCVTYTQKNNNDDEKKEKGLSKF